MWPVFKREVKAYFYSPIGYVFIGLFVFLAGMVFRNGVIGSMMPVFDYVLVPLAIFSTFLVPVLTMRLLADERKSGTEQLLMTSPRTITGLVAGKYLAALFVFICASLITLLYVLIMSMYGKPDVGPIISGYIGFILLGGAYISVGLFASSLTENQIISAVISCVILLFSWFASGTPVLSWISFIERYVDFINGLINLEQVIFFISSIALFIFLTVRVIEKRRWSRG
jgi:ABC-2 type transport system permease protein